MGNELIYKLGEIVEAQRNVMRAKLSNCICSGFGLQRDGCGCGHKKKLKKAKKELNDLLNNLVKDWEDE